MEQEMRLVCCGRPSLQDMDEGGHTHVGWLITRRGPSQTGWGVEPFSQTEAGFQTPSVRAVNSQSGSGSVPRRLSPQQRLCNGTLLNDAEGTRVQSWPGAPDSLLAPRSSPSTTLWPRC
ncbi:unnamed protein product [Pleuronectes platessa]|uniref:Uncharacterized protein n=1 Tax=Pleuronectes platessa TaxID=8262 RepID=A0A9N7Z3M5_PLEPL|nr:unnamed protein product [Pleuronectes platessa]